ncbi:hypothetical protein A167_02169 [Alcanivorax sp. S71-1-4]|uniref:B-box zinc finger protein n=1 Tax=Alcanivorax sp. S71-1-4 TaxID=1177159 RepID=UPI00135BB2A2|nr:B-box zinc finger protein [Alcanivorax sp. S71-1-4]KAF0809107.1 hypothetical protein A167_02169 [Alcanivorax sp. S71-1-4]
MKQTCKYHPGTPAQWYCPRDGIAFCDDCVGGEGDQARSLLSNKPLVPLMPALSHTPFWMILPFFLRYPLAPAAALMLLLAALPLALLSAHPAGWAMAALLWLVPLRYAVQALLSLSRGHFSAPPLTALGAPEGWPLTVGMAVIMTVTIGGPLLLAWQLDGRAVWLVLLPGLALVPSLLLALLRAGALPGALKIVHQPWLVLGVHGLAVTAFSVLLGALVAGAGWMLVDLLPRWLAVPLTAWLGGAGFLVLVAVLGYLACQWQEELDIPTPARLRRERRRRHRRPEDERRLQVLLREGRYDKVKGILRARLDKQPQSLVLQEQLMQLLFATGDHAAVLAQAEGWLQALLKHDQAFRVADIMRQLRALDEKYRPQDPALCADIAGLLREAGQPRQAVWLLQDLHQRTPEWNGLPQAYLLLARILATDLQWPAKAEQFIRFVESRFRQPQYRLLTQECREALGLAGG